MSSSSPADQFGPNEWLIEEMYERYVADPSSVDAAWHDFFADYKPTAQAEAATAGTAAATATAAPARQEAAAPAGPARTTAANQPDNGQVAATGTADRQADTKAGQPDRPGRDTRPASRPAAQRGAQPTAQSGKAAPKDTSTKAAPKTAPTGTAKDTAKDTAKAGSKPAAGTDAGLDDGKPLRGAAAVVVKNMQTSLSIPTATSVRAVPAKLIADNRIVINNHLARGRGGKVSFTHLIGYAVVRALEAQPSMNRHYAEVDGKPAVVTPEHVNLGLAIDLPGKDGQRSLVVASIKGCERLSFTQFWQAYEDLVRKARNSNLKTEDFAGTTITLTNPGTIGTNHSVPRLMVGQGCIVGVGAMEYPAPFQGASEQMLADMAVSKIITLTSTYDHRIIQGAESGEFLRRVHQLLLGEDEFYDTSSRRCGSRTSRSAGCRTSRRARSTRPPGCSSSSTPTATAAT